MPRSVLCCFPILLLFSSPTSFAVDLPETRGEFAKAFGLLKPQYEQIVEDNEEGDTQELVLEVLGPPDAIEILDRDRYGPWDKRSYPRTIWKYRSSGPGTFGTLGSIRFNEDLRIAWLHGRGTPPPAGMFTERELRSYLQALSEVRDWHNPRPLIRAVNMLQPLGKEKALLVIQEYLRVSEIFQDEYPLAVLRALFDCLDESSRNGADQAKHRKEVLLSGFSFVLTIGDIPYAFDYRVAIAGSVPSALDEMPYYRKHGIMRAHPLKPSTTPLQDIDDYVKKHPDLFENSDTHFDLEKREFQERALQLMESVYQPDLGWDVTDLPWGDDEEAKRQRREALEPASKITMVWDHKRHLYTFPNGTSLPPSIKPFYITEIWSPETGGGEFRLEIVRDNPNDVHIGLTKLKGHVDVKILVFSVNESGGIDEEAKPIAELSGEWGPNTGGGTGTMRILKDGERLRARLTVDGKTYTSRIFQP